MARLARLSLSYEEVALYTPQLEQILEHASRIDALPTDDVPPTSHPVEVGNVWRDDEPGSCLPADTVLALAPEAEAGRVKVPPP